MATTKVKKDVHVPSWTLDFFFRKLFEKPNRYDKDVNQGQVVADLGCGPGYYTFALADKVGPTGKVYAVDSDEKEIQVVEKKIAKRNYHNIESHTCSTANLDFIADETVDFVLADGLLCCVAPQDHARTVSEIKRILKPDGKAYLVGGSGCISYLNDEEWEDILKGFNVMRRNYMPYKGNPWAWVTK